MSNDLDYNFDEFSRQNILGVFILFIQSVRRTINAFLALFAATYFTNGVNSYTGTIIGLILVYLAVVSFLRYRNFEFKVSQSALILHSGILTKEVINIPYERIQSVQLSQNFFQRILSINGLKIDTAGSSTQELEIPALSRKKSTAFIAEIESRLEKSPDKKADAEESSNSANDESVSDPIPKDTFTQELVKLDFRGLVTIAITENHVRNGLIAVAFIFGYLNNYIDISEDRVIDFLEDNGLEFLEGTLASILLFGVLFLISSILISFVRTFLKFWDFKAELTDSAFLVKSGLLRRNEYTIPIRKIQFLEWRTNFLRQIPGFESIKIYQGSSDENTVRNNVEIPACYADQTNLVMDSLYPEHDDDLHLLNPHEFQIRFRAILFSLILLPATISSLVLLESYVLIPLVYITIVGLIIYSAFRYVASVNLWINDDLLIYERGWLFKKRTVLPLYKVQTVQINQSIFQQRRGICHLSFSTAAGERSLRFFNHNEMVELRDFLLYKAEVHKGSWM